MGYLQSPDIRKILMSKHVHFVEIDIAVEKLKPLVKSAYVKTSFETYSNSSNDKYDDE